MAKIREIIQLFKDEEIPVYTVGELAYERSVATANLLYRFARPDCVVQPKRASQVQIIVREAKARGIPITIKNGGHSYAGASTAEKGISLDLARMNGVKLDINTEVVTLQGGALWGNAYKELVNQKINKFVINGGRCPTVGVSGFILGGGLSPFTRSFGMGCDTLKEITIVTADGEKLTVKETDDPKTDKGRLFWALCGAGGGNFGVVVEMKLRVQRLQVDRVVAGRYTWSLDPLKMGDFMETMQEFYTVSWPNQLTVDSSWLCDLQQNNLAVRFLVYHNGNKAEFEKIIDNNITHDDLAKQLKRRSLEEAPSRFLHETLVAQWSEETEKSFPQNPSYMIYTSFVFKNDTKDIEAITEIIRDKMADFKKKFPGERGLLQVTWIHAGGKAASRKRSATAFRWRDCVYHTYIMVQWFEKFLEQDMWDFLNDFKKELRPYSMMGRAAFINFPDRALASDVHEKAYYGNNRGELQQIKRIWDKDNFFNWDQGISLPAEEMKEKKKKSTARRSRVENAVFARSFASNIADEEGSDAIDDISSEIRAMSMAAPGDEDVRDDEIIREEQPLADQLASRQWETVILPSQKLFDRGIYTLNDLGF
ncbi:fad-binding domain-containing [Trichoderma arundinaceum]|uniref:Fad-binding domain-containing n=1 Tax=Trichoderma arundinaceum TaxID=490622 RepID=A0A395NTZ2_TRIAR|nr:fad-binding domain-containing [Trichoderma arundinaceum]